LVFVIAGTPMRISGQELIIERNLPEKNKCVFAIKEIEPKLWKQVDWILGTTFMRDRCVLHDFGKGQIGFFMSHHG
jgi:hypothetical protein